MSQIKHRQSRLVHGLQHPVKATQFVLSKFRSQQGQRIAFWDRHFRNIPIERVVAAVDEYWKTYRCWSKVQDLIGGWTDKTILDVGCGYTSVLNILGGGDRYGLSIEIEDLRDRPGYFLNKDIRWINGTAERLPFTPGCFDVVFCNNGVDHYESPQGSVDEMVRVLKPGGWVVLSINIFETDIGARDSQHHFSFTREKFLGLLTQFDVMFEKISPVAAQISRLLEGRVIDTPEEKEMIVVARLKT